MSQPSISCFKKYFFSEGLGAYQYKGCYVTMNVFIVVTNFGRYNSSIYIAHL